MLAEAVQHLRLGDLAARFAVEDQGRLAADQGLGVFAQQGGDVAELVEGVGLPGAFGRGAVQPQGLTSP